MFLKGIFHKRTILVVNEKFGNPILVRPNIFNYFVLLMWCYLFDKTIPTSSGQSGSFHNGSAECSWNGFERKPNNCKQQYFGPQKSSIHLIRCNFSVCVCDVAIASFSSVLVWLMFSLCFVKEFLSVTWKSCQRIELRWQKCV